MAVSVRCSFLPLFMQCPASITYKSSDDRGPYRPRRYFADLGSAVHKVLARMVREKSDIIPALAPIIHEYGIADEHELRILIAIGRRMLLEIAGGLEFYESEREVAIDGSAGEVPFSLTGTMDLLGREGEETIVVLDWKTGWFEGIYDEQLMGYLKLAWAAYPEFEKAKIVTLWVRDQVADAKTITRADVEAWFGRFKLAVQSTADHYPGDQCSWCPGFGTCQRRKTYAIESVRSIGELAGMSDETMMISAEKLALLYPRARFIARELDRYDAIMKTALQQSGAELPTGDGRILSVKLKARDELKPDYAIDRIVEALECGDAKTFIQQYPDAVSFKMSEIKDAVAHHAGRGHGAKAIKKLMESLEADHAIEHKQTVGIVARKA